MDFGTVIGLIAGLAIIAVGVVRNGGDLYWFYNLNSILIVFGGTFAATLVNYPLKHVFNIFRVVKNVFTEEEYDYQNMINQIVEKAEKARKSGVISLEADLPNIEDSFLRNGLELAINERDPGLLRTYLRLELNNIERRHGMGQEIFFYMGAYAPAFGMLGTIIGLIIMMNNFSGAGDGQEIDAMSFNVAQKFAELLGGMGLALITTFYGVLLANLVFLPIGGKLKRKSENEMMLKNIVLEGIISIHRKDHPILIKEKLMTFVPRTERQLED
ncbi:MAG: MotA/TolQ/ExbB proton channel family protein [Candidatus Marinimicrobia bacterium]|nr:MotA/TolQ/ExbB proton channel family protein [Candidatus Neomarinimicrobiota bacterium]